ncbi:hypothetical protein HYG81_21455 (plasmid) [Natrinema zhouii]|uniref:DUF7344 domain-containing protein n=1 Tax=Natrinema zhouii TaxID=1710539 RepID=UPI001CFFAF7E|nr:hypothetical protein [Natrinema zhouii]UHQ98144.1 hypothetical protein HYG81_21455 [Natrinema zhouii]
MVLLDTVFDLLSNERRRFTLYYLKEQDGPVSVDELVATIAEWEDNPPRDFAEDGLERLEITLEHQHLPKSAEVDFIEYRPEEGIIQTKGIPPEVGALVTLARIIEQPAND